MDKIKPQTLDLVNGNVKANWRRWSQAMRLCLNGPLLENTAEKQQAIYFLLDIGQDGGMCSTHGRYLKRKQI